MCVQSFHMVNIDVPAGVGPPPHSTHNQCPSLYIQAVLKPFSTAIGSRMAGAARTAPAYFKLFCEPWNFEHLLIR